MLALRAMIADNAARAGVIREEMETLNFQGDPDNRGDGTRMAQLRGYMEWINKSNTEALEELERIDPTLIAARISREREAAKKIVKKDKALKAAAEAKAESSQRREKSDRDRMMVLQDTVTTMLDVFSETYQLYIQGKLDKTEALHSIEQASSVMQFVEEDRKLLTTPEASMMAANLASGAFKSHMHHVALITSDEKLLTNVADWEELIPDGDDPICIPPAAVQAQLLNGVSLSFPFEEMKPKMQQSAAHPRCNSTRIVISTLLYMKAARRAREARLAAGELRPPVVFDIGAGHFGAERIQQLKLDARNHGIALHVSIPDANPDDAERLTKVRSDPTFLGWNFVPETRRVVMNGLNYCRHLARDCDCWRYYAPGGRVALTIHSAYELDQRDWSRTFAYTNVVEAAVHMPKLGETLPLSTPEYEWSYAADDPDASILDKLGYLARNLLTGRRVVKLKPLRCGATTYIQDTSLATY